MKFDFWKKPTVLWGVYLLAAVLVAVQKISIGKSSSGYTAYENYLIFKNAFPHLALGQNLYAPYPEIQWDLFKYSPAFALFMGFFAGLPDWLGLSLWNLLNASVLLSSILALPVLDAQKRSLFAWFVLLEFISSTQNSQSNCLVAGLTLWTFTAFFRGGYAKAALFIASSAFIKIFGIVAALLGLFFPKKIPFAVALLGWALILVLIPLLVTSPELLENQYVWWLDLLKNDHSASIGLSFMGWLQTWFGLEPSKSGVLFFGALVLSTSIFWAATVRKNPNAPALALASLLIWVVIFNHKAESPTFIIALCGVALWYFRPGKRLVWENVLLAATFLLASVSPTDLFPRILRETLVQPYVLKAVPCIIVWFLITYKLFDGSDE